jgi:RNA polymerase sigma-70 factor (ECF subfamily)
VLASDTSCVATLVEFLIGTEDFEAVNYGDQTMDSFAATRFPTLPLSKRETANPSVVTNESKCETEYSDELLLSLIAAADREALAILFRRHYRLVYWIAGRVLRNTAEAEDLAQDVFLHIVRKCHLYNSAKGTARSWIVRITYHQALNRKEYLEDRHYYTAVNVGGKSVSELGAPGIADYDHSGEAVFGRTRWLQMRDVLTDDQWEVIRLHFFEGCTFAEIGEKRKQRVGKVRHHFYRGLARLRKCIFQDELRGC